MMQPDTNIIRYHTKDFVPRFSPCGIHVQYMRYRVWCMEVKNKKNEMTKQFNFYINYFMIKNFNWKKLFDIGRNLNHGM